MDDRDARAQALEAALGELAIDYDLGDGDLLLDSLNRDGWDITPLRGGPAALLEEAADRVEQLEAALTAVNDCCNHDHIPEVAAALEQINR